jgi:hypothetical protein
MSLGMSSSVSNGKCTKRKQNVQNICYCWNTRCCTLCLENRVYKIHFAFDVNILRMRIMFKWFAMHIDENNDENWKTCFLVLWNLDFCLHSSFVFLGFTYSCICIIWNDVFFLYLLIQDRWVFYEKKMIWILFYFLCPKNTEKFILVHFDELCIWKQNVKIYFILDSYWKHWSLTSTV